MSLKLVEFEEGYYVRLFFRDGGAETLEVSDPKNVVDKKDVLIVTINKGDVAEVQKSALAFHRITYFKRQVQEQQEVMKVEPSTGPEDLR